MLWDSIIVKYAVGIIYEGWCTLGEWSYEVEC